MQREWTEGEPQLVAALLESLGRISDQRLGELQIHYLEQLHQESITGSDAHLRIARHLAGTYWGYSRAEDAIEVLEVALDAHRKECGGTLPADTNDVLNIFVGYLENRGRHAQGERVLEDLIEHAANKQQALWATHRLFQLYTSALHAGSTVSLGTGERLYQEVTRRYLQELQYPDANHLDRMLSELMRFYTEAHEREIGDASDDVVVFAEQQLPALTERTGGSLSQLCQHSG